MKEKLRLLLALLPKGAMSYMGVILAITLISGLASMPMSASSFTPVVVSAIGGIFGRIIINVMLKANSLGLPFSEDWGRGGIALGAAIILFIV